MTDLSIAVGARHRASQAGPALHGGLTPEDLGDPTPVEPLRVAILIPCLNEEATIAKVVGDFRRELPEAAVYVIDNASTDATAARASAK